MRIFKTKPFARFAERNGIDDASLREAVDRAVAGLVDADLGGGVLKQRVTREGEGRSGGFRTVVLFRSGVLAIFAYGFAKKDRDNIRRDELVAFRKLAKTLLNLDETGMARAIAVGAITEVTSDV